MKKTLCAALALTLVFALAACGQGSENPGGVTPSDLMGTEPPATPTPDPEPLDSLSICGIPVIRGGQLSGLGYEGMDYAVEDSGLEALFAGPTDEERLHAAIRQLSPDQQEMVRAIYFENVSVNDYAARMGVTQSAISHRLQTVKKKLKKLLV